MKVLITGAEGFVGQNLCAALEEIRLGHDNRPEHALGSLTVYPYDLGNTAEAPMGLSGLIRHPEEAERAIIHTERLGLDVILAGDVPVNPSELLGSAGWDVCTRRFIKRWIWLEEKLPPGSRKGTGFVVS